MICCIRVVASIVLCIGLINASQASVTAPTGLDVGDSYRLVFITSSSFRITGESTDVDDYNQLATDAANSQTSLANLNTNWFAIVSTPGDDGVDAKINTGTDDSPSGNNGVPIFLVDGDTKVVDHYDDLWDSSVDTQIDLTEEGTPVSGNSVNDFVVWTGTVGDGTVNTAQPLGSSFFVGRGQWGERDTRWIAGFGGLASNELSIYAISDVLTVQPPGEGLLGDFNGDELVDLADYTVWRNNLGANDSVLADGSTSSVTSIVDHNEYASWKSNFGATAGLTTTVGSAKIPEPSSLAIVALGGFISFVVSTSRTTSIEIKDR